MRVTSVLAGLAAAVLTATLTALPADATNGSEKITTCGQEITGNAYLAQDLTCTTGFRLISTEDLRARTGDENAAVDFTLDLRGHRVRGPGTGVLLNVEDFPFAPTMRVVNGRADHWGTAFAVDFGTLSLDRVRLDHNSTAMDCFDGTCSIEHSVISHNQVGTSGFETGYRLVGNTFVGNAVASAAAVDLSSSTYTHNVFVGNQTGITITSDGAGTISRNVFSRNGVGIQGANVGSTNGFDYSVTKNLFSRNGDGVHVTLSSEAGDQLALGSNTAVRNKGYGIFAPGAQDLGGNREAHNGTACVGVVCSHP